MENQKLPENLSGVHIHFVGVKGTGMAALVEIFYHNGAIITGSDVSEKFYTDEILSQLKIIPTVFSEDNITKDIQYVVYSSAYKIDKNPELIKAVELKIPCLLYSEALGQYSNLAYSCGVCGVHGKTSTTGLAGTILSELDLPSQVLAGSVINSFGGKCTYTSKNFSESASKKNSYFVAETCEYQRHFMSFCPQKIILTSVESDHQDYYPHYEDIRDAFVDYICKLPKNGDLIYCIDDKGCVDTVNELKKHRDDINLIPYGFTALGDYRISELKLENEKQSFNISCLGNAELSVPGKHEVLDSVAAVALICRLLISDEKNPKDYFEKIKKGLLKFSGGKRRSEIVGKGITKNGDSIIVIDDYGHHPTAIKTTLDGYKEFYSNRKIIVDFMSHTYSRTQALLEEFASSFVSADVVILHKIYASARENKDDFSITGKTLFEKAKKYSKNVYYFEEIMDASSFVEEEINQKNKNGYLFVTMGAGDNWKIGRYVVDNLIEKK